MLNELDNFYFRQEEPLKSCLLALRKIILEYDDGITEAWTYSTPFFVYKKKNLCYLWILKKTREPYIGFAEGRNIEHPKLMHGSRSHVKIMILDPRKDIPIRTIRSVLRAALRLYA